MSASGTAPQLIATNGWVARADLVVHCDDLVVQPEFAVAVIDRFRPGIAMIASRLDVPVALVRLDGLDAVLHHTWRMARPGRARVRFGAPLHLRGDDYEALAKEVEDAVKSL